MKKRIRKTGEIVDVITYNDCSSKTKRKKYDYVSYIDSNGTPHYLERGLNIYWDFEDVEEELTKNIDWEQVRIDAAMTAMNGILTNDELQSLAFDGRRDKNNREIPVYVSEMAVSFADALIAELKKGGKDHEQETDRERGNRSL